MKKFYFTFCLIFILFISTYSQWVSNSYFNNDSIPLIAINNNHIYLLSQNKGLFISSDQGNNWYHPNSALPASQINKISVVGDSIFLATSIGVFLSTDKGSTWNSFNDGFNYYSQIITSIIKDNHIFIGTPDGIFSSTDNGVTWRPVNNGLDDSFLTISLVSANNSIFSANQRGIYKSGNNGSDWLKVSDINAVQLIVKDNIIFAGTAASGVFASTDEGISWNSYNNGLTVPFIYSLYVYGEYIYAGTLWGVFRSSDDGLTWSSFSNGLPDSPTVRCFASNDSGLFIGTESGIFHCLNDDTSWTSVNDTIAAKSFASLDGNLFAGTGFEGIFVSTDNGTTWTEANNGLPENEDVYSFTINENKIYAGLIHGFYVSTDNGLNWISLSTGLPNHPNVELININGKDILASTWEDVFLSTDGGMNWNNITNGMFVTGVSSIAFINNAIYVCTHSKIYRSTDKGLNWITYTNGLPNDWVYNISPYNNYLYLTTRSYGVFYSSDDGENWVQSGDEHLKYNDVTSLAFNNNQVIAGTQGSGIYLSSDYGRTWANANVGLIDAYTVLSLGIIGEKVFAGTLRGLWSCDLNNIQITAIDNHNTLLKYMYSLAQNYPNPFNPVTKIKYSLPYLTQVTLKIYDMLGREVTTLVNEEKPAGYFEVEFNGSGLTSGIYFYQLKAGNFAETKKLVLLK